MTEPVGYMYRKSDREDWLFTLQGNVPYGNYKYIKPVYTAEQLHQRVKMTEKQYKEWQQVINNIYPFNLYELFNLIFNPAEHKGDYAGMRDIFSFDEGQKKLARLWSNYDPDNPEETIEIIPTMKWFVRSKKKEINGHGWLSNIEKYETPLYQYSGDKPFKNFPCFDTKEEAERWVNPLTEAVHLPVEDER